MKTKFVVLFVAVLLLIAGGWVWYALSISDRTLADQGRCSQPVRIKAVDATRHLFGRKTSSEAEADVLKQYSNPLQLPASLSCPD